MSGEELYNADVAKDPTFLDGRPRPTWERLGPIFRKSWDQKAAELKPPCDFCNQPGHSDAPCPVRHESAMRHAEEGAKAYPPETGVEAMVCQRLRERTVEDGCKARSEIMCREIASRQRLGVAKYGTTLADNPARLRDRLRHGLEESLDLAVYARWAALECSNHQSVPAYALIGIENRAVAIASELVHWMMELEKEESPMLTTEGGQP
jgi:hypothetical protein